MIKKILFVGFLAAGSLDHVIAQQFSIASATSYPFPAELTVNGDKVALAVNEQGKRNIYVAQEPAFELRKLTTYDTDDAQEITSIEISNDGKRVVYVRGGDHGAYDGSIPRNPASAPQAPHVQVMSIPFEGGEPVVLGDGDYPQVTPAGDKVAFLKGGDVWIVPVDGSHKAQKLFYARGSVQSISWSPDGKQLLFSAARGSHSFIGIFTDSATPLQWIAPSLARDVSPRWSPDGQQIVFIRRPASGGAPDSLTVPHHDPWAIWVAQTATGEARQLWKAPETLRGSVPATQGGYNLHWAAGDRIVFVSYQDGWPHLYSLPAAGGTPLLLTKGNYMVEHIHLTPDKKWLIASANTGPDKDDLHRRHLIKVPVDKAAVQVLTPGTGIETYGFLTGSGRHIVLLSATTTRPTVLGVMPANGGSITLAGASLIPKDYPSRQFVTPRPVQFRAADGVTVYGQLYTPAGGPAHKPAILFIHGGPRRQMLLGWHYGDYYANTYALNQYLVSQGFMVLSVNYRLGIGYGYEFQQPLHTWTNGAAEYQDIKAAGEWLAAQPQVDTARIGVYGGSYGGYLTAMALAKDSKLFKAGVDLHGVHNLSHHNPDPNGEQAPDAELARRLIWQSSPVAWIDGWTSPVLFIHGDDDGNVNFDQTVDLTRRLDQRGFHYESLVVPDETHHWLKYSNILKVDQATADFLQQHLLP